MFNKNLAEELQCSLSIPSTTHTYSVVTEFIKQWFLSKFTNQYFKHVYIDGKHVFDDIRKFNLSHFLKLPKPTLAIIPRINLEYNRDMLDTNPFGIDMIMKTGRLERALIRDFKRNLFIGNTLEALDIRYTFLMRVDSRAQQIDLYKYLCMAFSVGHTIEENIDIDYHIPYGMMLQLAKDSGYEINVYNNIVDIIGFTRYVNSISRLPINFKYRTINGKTEFFIRYNDIDIMINNTQPLSFNDGELRGMLHKNFTIEMEITVRVPTPKFYLYYSSNKHDLIYNISSMDPNSKSDVIYPIYTIEMTRVPKINEKGWNQYLTTEYYDEDLSKPLEIDFSGLFQEGVDVYRVIKLSLESGISPDIFIDFKLYNGNKNEILYTIDWETVTLKLEEEVTSPSTYIAIYIDTKYVFDKIKELDKLETTRLQDNRPYFTKE